MTHLFLSVTLASLSLALSIRRNGSETGFLSLSLVPGALLLIALIADLTTGFWRFAEVTYHFAYDLSYVLLLVGLCLILRNVVKRKRMSQLLVGAFLSALPIIQLLLPKFLPLT